jgi:hypothetical protein
MPGMDMACAALAYTVVVGLGFELKFVSLSQPNLDTLRYARCRADQLGAGFHWALQPNLKTLAKRELDFFFFCERFSVPSGPEITCDLGAASPMSDTRSDTRRSSEGRQRQREVQ